MPLNDNTLENRFLSAQQNAEETQALLDKINSFGYPYRIEVRGLTLEGLRSVASILESEKNN